MTPYRVTVEATIFVEDGCTGPEGWDDNELLDQMKDAPDVSVVSSIELVEKI